MYELNDEQMDYIRGLLEQLDGIKWMSIDKDNMEFRATITCFTRDKINHFRREIDGILNG